MRRIAFYSVRTDPDRYQEFGVGDDARKGFDKKGYPYAFDGRPKAKQWKPPPVFSDRPQLPEPDFWGLGWGACGAVFAVRPEALERTKVARLLHESAELLPLPYQGRLFQVVNVIECIDALDRDASDWRLDERRKPYAVRKPVFRLDRLGASLFKIPETAFARLYCWEDSERADDQFKAYVERAGLTGLVFDELYAVQPP